MQFFVGDKIQVTIQGGGGEVSTLVGVVSYRDPAPSALYRVVISRRGEYLQVDIKKRQATFAYSSKVFQIVETKPLAPEDEELEELVEKNSQNLLNQGRENGNLRMSEGKSNRATVASRRLLENFQSLKETTMAAIDLSKIVVGTRGKVATEAFIAIRNNGQIQFNSLAEKEIEGATRVSFDWDPGKGVFAMIFGGDDLKNSLSISRGKDGQGTLTISGAGVLRAVGFQFQEGNCKLISGSDYKLGKNKTGLSTLVVSGFLTKPRVPATQRAPKSAVVATAVTAADGNENDEVDTDGIL